MDVFMHLPMHYTPPSFEELGCHPDELVLELSGLIGAGHEGIN